MASDNARSSPRGSRRARQLKAWVRGDYDVLRVAADPKIEVRLAQTSGTNGTVRNGRVVRADGFFGPERKGVVEALGVGQ